MITTSDSIISTHFTYSSLFLLYTSNQSKRRIGPVLSHSNKTRMNKSIFTVALIVGAIINGVVVTQAAAATATSEKVTNNNNSAFLSTSSSFDTNKLNKFQQRSVQEETDSSNNITTISNNNETSAETEEEEEEVHTDEDEKDDHSDSAADDSCHCDGDVVHCWGDADESLYHCHDGVIESEATTSTSASTLDAASAAASAAAHSADCHCDGDVAHCSDAADEASYDCSSTVYKPDCHCDADVVHCMDGIGDDYCSCTKDGILECVDSNGINIIMVEDDIRNVDAADGKPWGEVIITSLIINLSTLVGVFVVAGAWFMKRFFPNAKTSKATGILWMDVLIPMFACGALLATTFFLLLPESFSIIMAEFTGIDPHEGHNHRRFLEGDVGGEEDEPLGASAGTWRWGASIMGGFWIPVMMHSCFPHDHSGTGGHSHGNHVHDNQKDGEESNQNNDPTLIENGDNNTKTFEKQETVATATGIKESEDIIKSEEAVAVVLVTSGDDDSKDVTDNNSDSNATTDNDDDSDEYVLCCCGLIRLKNLPLFVSMNLGEALHNFTDGIFVGTAWLLCGNSLAISIALATILHELPNQLAGYLVMVNQCGINPFVALILNFLFGLSILFGGLLVLVFEFNQVTIGCILAIGAGTFIHVAIGELLQHAERNMTSGVQMIYSFIAFLVGAIPIGLILINHEHC